MKPGWRAVAAGVAAYLVFLLMTAPANRLLAYIQPQLQGVQLAGVSGSIWSGEAAQVNAGAAQLTAVSWSWRPLALFKAALEVDIDAQLSGRPLSARAGRGVFTGSYLADVEGRLPAGELLRWMRLQQVNLDGHLEFSLDTVEWNANPVPAVSGNVAWVPAMVSHPIELNLGEVQLTTEMASGATEGQLTARGGALAVNDGRVSLQPDGRYQLNATVRKQGAVPVEVEQFLSTFAEFRDGGYLLEWSDQIKF